MKQIEANKKLDLSKRKIGPTSNSIGREF